MRQVNGGGSIVRPRMLNTVSAAAGVDRLVEMGEVVPLRVFFIFMFSVTSMHAQQRLRSVDFRSMHQKRVGGGCVPK